MKREGLWSNERIVSACEEGSIDLLLWVELFERGADHFSPLLKGAADKREEGGRIFEWGRF